jgi:orotate phosphoribosyltransferase-like protein
MSLIEDRLLRIIELRQKGLEDIAIASDLGISEEMLKTYEETAINEVQDMAQSGRKIDRISRKTGISSLVVRLLMDHYNIETSSKDTSSIGNEKREIIEGAISEGAKTRNEIVSRTGLSYPVVAYWVNELGIETKSPREAKLEDLRDLLIRNEVSTYDEVSEKLGVSKEYARVLLFQIGSRFIKVHEKAVERGGMKRRENLDNLVEQGATQAEIADEAGWSRERARQYINRTGQYETWKEARQKKRNEEKSIIGQENTSKRELLRATIKRAYENTDPSTTEGWAQRKAYDYISATDGLTTYPFDSLVDIFRKYREAQKNGERLSLAELGESAGINYPQVGKILKKIGLEPMHGKRKKRMGKLSEEQEEQILRARDLSMPARDIAYFLSLPDHVVKTRIGTRPKGTQSYIRRFYEGFAKPKGVLSYGVASQIYEADDAGFFDEFSKEEIAELLSTSTQAIHYALTNRESIAPKIIDALRVINPEGNIDKPYLNHTN